MGDVQVLIPDAHNTAGYAVENGTGNLLTRRTLPYGGQRGEISGVSTSSTWASTRGFVNGTLNAGTGLITVGARTFDPHAGRFISVDPILDPTDPQQINGYTYANNSPLAFSDPTGLKLCGDDQCTIFVNHSGQVQGPGYQNGKYVGNAAPAGQAGGSVLGILSAIESSENLRDDIESSAAAARLEKELDDFASEVDAAIADGARIPGINCSTTTDPDCGQPGEKTSGFVDPIDAVGRVCGYVSVLECGFLWVATAAAVSLSPAARVETSAVRVVAGTGTRVAAAAVPAAIHGNSASSTLTAYLYRLSHVDGTYLKTGISQNPGGRYSKTFMADKEMVVLHEGPRRQMLNLERFIVERDPGKLNRERWAGNFTDDVP